MRKTIQVLMLSVAVLAPVSCTRQSARKAPEPVTQASPETGAESTTSTEAPDPQQNQQVSNQEAPSSATVGTGEVIAPSTEKVMAEVEKLKLTPSEERVVSQIPATAAGKALRDFVVGYGRLETFEERRLLIDNLVEHYAHLDPEIKGADLRRAYDAMNDKEFPKQREFLSVALKSIEEQKARIKNKKNAK